MAVYVDDLLPTGYSQDWPFGFACHLMADTTSELHRFAVEQLGLKRSWFQGDGNLPHYDLTKNKRLLAVKRGATEIDRRAVSELIQRYRDGANS